MPVRPKSIVQFEQVYWGVIVLGLVNMALGWDDMMVTVAVQQTIARFGMAMIYIPVVLGVLLQLLFWYFIARRGSVIAKWIFVVLTGAGAVWSAITLATAGAPSAAAGVVGVALVVLSVIAIVLLFRPDTRPWFGEDTVAA